MHLFDANCMLGRRSIHTPLDVPTTVEALLAEMDRLGIAEALVYHGMALDGFPPEGNARLMREIAGHPRLHPCWVLLPTTGEMPPPKSLVAQMREQGVRAARLCPVRHRYLCTEANVGDLLRELERARIPLFVDFGMVHWSEEKTDWRSLDDLCGRYPDLPFIVVGEGMAAPRRLFPLWERHRNLYLETHYYQVNQGLSEVARRFGADRLLFGTGLPYRAPGPPLMQLRCDFLATEERAAIGGGNLRGLLERAHGGLPSLPQPEAKEESADLLSASIFGGAPRIISAGAPRFIDAHAHLGGWFSTYIHAGEADGLVRNMDRLHIRATAIIAFDAIAADMRGGNDRVAAAMRAYPGRFLGYATVDPNEPRAMTAELERCFGRLGFHAIKFHCDTHGCPADSDNYRPALEYADARGLAVLIHGRITEGMLTAYPNAQFLSAHVGGWDGRAPHYAIELCRDYPNIHCELCCSTVYNGALERMVERVGADRIVHGSDTPLMDAGYQLGRVLAAKISEEEKERILYRNAERLFRL
jgi:predicted TIM-barrel fold metal-dependent hydrolase